MDNKMKIIKSAIEKIIKNWDFNRVRYFSQDYLIRELLYEIETQLSNSSHQKKQNAHHNHCHKSKKLKSADDFWKTRTQILCKKKEEVIGYYGFFF